MQVQRLVAARFAADSSGVIAYHRLANLQSGFDTYLCLFSEQWVGRHWSVNFCREMFFLSQGRDRRSDESLLRHGTSSTPACLVLMLQRASHKLAEGYLTIVSKAEASFFLIPVDVLLSLEPVSRKRYTKLRCLVSQRSYLSLGYIQCQNHVITEFPIQNHDVACFQPVFQCIEL